MRHTLALTLGVSAPAMTAVRARTRQNIQRAGSLGVLPVASVVAEDCGAAFPQSPTPVVASGGSGGGLRRFCEGVGPRAIAIAGPPRAVRPAEIDTGAADGVTDIRNSMFGDDGIAFATRTSAAALAPEPRPVDPALGPDRPAGTTPPTHRSRIDPSVAARRVLRAIAASNHGTRDVFAEKAVISGCRAVPGADTAHDLLLQLRQDSAIDADIAAFRASASGAAF